MVWADAAALLFLVIAFLGVMWLAFRHLEKTTPKRRVPPNTQHHWYHHSYSHKETPPKRSEEKAENE